jgi:hypothetical protein
MGGNLDRGTEGSAEIGQLRKDFYLKDAFRVIHKNKVEFSFREGPVHVRLDRFYISGDLAQWVDKMKHTPCTVSDHYYADLEFKAIDYNTNKYGPGFWKCNVEVLKDKNFISALETLWVDKLVRAGIKDGEWWETCKIEFKKLIIKFSRKLSDRIGKQIRLIENEIRNTLELRGRAKLTQRWDTRLDYLKDQLNNLLLTKTRGARIRARALLLEENEKPSRFFFRKETDNNKHKIIQYLKVNDREINNPVEIVNEITNFYRELYTAPDTDMNAINTYIQTCNLPRLQPHEVASCEGPVTYTETYNALTLMKNGKTPGSDGLPVEFYKQFYYLFGTYLVALYNLSFKNGSLTESQRLSLIILLCKDPAKHFLLNYWRPISLLNIDYKILSKTMSIRLGRVLPSIINIDQTCSIIGRSILDNCHLLRNVYDFVSYKNIRCAYINIDQAKAFDRVSHGFLYSILVHFGFGPDFINWISVLYSDISSSVIVNGHIDEPFKLQRSVRQGCALSPLLYVLTMEPFADTIRRNPTYKGLDLPGLNNELRISQYADDTTLFVGNEQSIQLGLELAQQFGEVSGAKINVEKTCGLWAGAWRNRSDKPFGINWVKEKKLLGIMLGQRDSGDKNWENILNKFKKTVDMVMDRKLSIYGRAMMLNTLAISKVVYVGSVQHMPDEYMNKFNKILYTYIWNKKQEVIKREALSLPKHKGGIALVNLKLKMESLLIKHIVEYLSYVEYTPKWTFLTTYWLGLSLNKYRPGLHRNDMPHSHIDRPPFYSHCIITFNKFLHHNPMVEIKKLSCQKIYHTLLDNMNITPRIVTQFPRIPFKKTWPNIYSHHLDTEIKEVSFRTAHNVLQTNFILFSHGIGDTAHCTLCGGPQLETTKHLFIACEKVQPLWVFIKELFRQTCNHRLKCTFLEVVLCQPDTELPRNFFKVFIYTIALAKYCIWFHRCEVKYEHRRIDAQGILRNFIKLFKYRVTVDYFYMDAMRFIETWPIAPFVEYNTDTLSFNM